MSVNVRLKKRIYRQQVSKRCLKRSNHWFKSKRKAYGNQRHLLLARSRVARSRVTCPPCGFPASWRTRTPVVRSEYKCRIFRRPDGNCSCDGTTEPDRGHARVCETRLHKRTRISFEIHVFVFRSISYHARHRSSCIIMLRYFRFIYPVKYDG